MMRTKNKPANLGAELLSVLKSKALGEWEYYNPHALLALTEIIESYYGEEDEVVDEWIADMFSS